jgi:hypothetical protein
MSPADLVATEAMQWLVLLLGWLGAIVICSAVIHIVRWFRQ